MTQLVALFEDPEGPCARLRFHAFRPALERLGVRVSVHGIPGTARARRRLWRMLPDHDVVYWQRRLLVPWHTRLLRRGSRRLVYDFDDALMVREHAPHASWVRRGKLATLLRVADQVLAGNEELARRSTPIARAVAVLPTPVLPATPRLARPRSSRTLLWVGQPATLPYLEELLPDLQPLFRQEPELELHVLGAGKPRGPGLDGRLVSREWSVAAEREALARSTLGLAPLPDNLWTQGKCGARLLSYLGGGLPAVASPVGAQAQIAELCGGCLLARSGQDWRAAVQGLLGDSARRQELGQAGRQGVEQHYSVAGWEERFCHWVLGPA